MTNDTEQAAPAPKSVDIASEQTGENSQDLGRQEQGDLDHNDYDVETVERVYRYACLRSRCRTDELPLLNQNQC